MKPKQSSKTFSLFSSPVVLKVLVELLQEFGQLLHARLHSNEDAQDPANGYSIHQGTSEAGRPCQGNTPDAGMIWQQPLLRPTGRSLPHEGLPSAVLSLD